MQSTDAKAADAAGSATGTTIKIAVYRSSYPLLWDTGDADAPDATKVVWSKPDAWPKEGSPGSAVGAYAGYSEADEPTRPGFEFLGWSAVKDDPTVAGKLSSLSIPEGTEPVAGDDGVKRITLHALWAPISYSVVFDLTKNPEDASAVPSFNWTTGKGTFSDLGGGRYRLSGVTLEDYDPERGLIEISTPSRGTGGYRFLSWAEPDSQQDPTVAMQPSGTSKWYVNPVALPYYDYEPVLTARWSLSFDVDVPSQITFDEYDSLEQEGNLTDATDKNAVDEESPDLHDKGKLAHFCSQSTAVDYKIVALKSEMQATAKDILTTSDSSKATQDEVLGSEKLLSLFATTDTSEGAGVHFKLDDAIDMDDSSRFGAFVIPKQTKEYSDADFARDDENRLYVSYRLNLDNAVDGATEPNHGLVTPGNVSEGDRTPIAKVSYEFAVADHETVVSDDVFYIEYDGVRFGLSDIRQAARDISAHGEESRFFGMYDEIMRSVTHDMVIDPSYDADATKFFQLRVGDDSVPVQLIGIYDDVKTSGAKAGFTFQFKNVYIDMAPCATASNAAYGWADTSGNSSRVNRIREWLRTTLWDAMPDAVKNEVATVSKYQQLFEATNVTSATSLTERYLQGPTSDTIFLLSAYEVLGRGLLDKYGSYPGYANFYNNEGMTSVSGYAPMQYDWYRLGSRTGNLSFNNTVRTLNGSPRAWYFRSGNRGSSSTFLLAQSDTNIGSGISAATPYGVVPAFCL